MAEIPKSISIQRDLTVGEVAVRSGIRVSAVHFYEAKGLIHAARSSGNQRRFAREVLRRIAVIKVAQRAGIPLARIKQALSELPAHRAPGKADWERLSAEWHQDLEERIRRLTRLRDQMTLCIGCGCLSTEHCPLRNPGDELGAEGPGPRLMDPAG
ncbi:MAG TPA: redox-sensitive transcriptional activator SoxR [Sphingomicrobium sp.]|nr:redox-sensitive transcriptional activator SoxR [Sphingomicrobium sp.]